MPKIPVDFSLGYYEDTNSRLGNRQNYNCYPETTVGAVNKTVLRSVEGYSKLLADSSSTPSDAIMVDGVIYYVARDRFYSSSSPYTTSTLIGNISAAFLNSPAKLVSNGKTIVILNTQTTAATDDYYYDIAGATLATIASFDADYAGFGKAKDVTFKDGYYVFITENAIFHGDNASTGTGLSFNPLSFAAIPAQAGAGVGLEVANSQVYVFTRKKTFIYQTASTTPFSFARSTGFDMDLGLTSYAGKTTFEDQIFVVGVTQGSVPQCYIISGTSFKYVGNQSADEFAGSITSLGRGIISSYQFRGHRFIHLAQNPIYSPIGPTIVLDLTETLIKGAPMWHYRAVASGLGGFISSYIYKYLDISDIPSSGVGSVFALGVRDGFRGATIYKARLDQSYGNSEVFDLTTSDENLFSYTFPFIRADGEPVDLKRVRLRFTDNVTEVELFITEDGTTFTSLGSFDLTNIDSKTAEWRRIGRVNEDAAFKVHYKTDYVSNQLNAGFGNKAGSLIEGYLEV